jgi:hypothetical protein
MKMAYKLMYKSGKNKRSQSWDRKIYSNKTTAVMKLQEANAVNKKFSRRYKQSVGNVRLVSVGKRKTSKKGFIDSLWGM